MTLDHGAVVWGWWLGLGGLASRWAGPGTGRRRPSDHDLVIVEAMSEVAARSTSCQVCDRPLSDRVGLEPGPDDAHGGWALFAVTRCRGWRRHPHRASVVEIDGDLVIDRFDR